MINTSTCLHSLPAPPRDYCFVGQKLISTGLSQSLPLSEKFSVLKTLCVLHHYEQIVFHAPLTTMLFSYYSHFISVDCNGKDGEKVTILHLVLGALAGYLVKNMA